MHKPARQQGRYSQRFGCIALVKAIACVSRSYFSVGDGIGAGVRSDGSPGGVGESIGLIIGLGVGITVGEPVGELVGEPVGDPVGDSIGDIVGVAVMPLRDIGSRVRPIANMAGTKSNAAANNRTNFLNI